MSKSWRARALRQKTLLAVEALSKAFGGLLAVNGYSLRLDAGEIVGLIGPNGAGKTTVINIISGLETPTRGQVVFNKRELRNHSPQYIARCGLARTFQNLRLFNDYSVRDNVVTALLTRRSYTLLDTIFNTKRFRSSQYQLRQEAEALLTKVNLLAEADLMAAELPYGKQRRLEIARALALNPRLLLLDEPAAGMVDQEQQELATLLKTLREEGLTLLIVDHNIRFLLSIVDRVQVMHHGELIAEGEPKIVMNDPTVIEAYLGEEVAA